MNLKLLALTAIFLFSDVAQAQSAGKIITDAVQVYKNYKDLTKEPEENELQTAAKHASPSMAYNKKMHKKQRAINECHKQNDVVFWGSTFVSTKCTELELQKYETNSDEDDE